MTEKHSEALVIGRSGVSDALPMGKCIRVMEEMFGEALEEIATQPARTITRVDEQSVILTMPSYSSKLKRFAVKLVTEYKRNPRVFGLPRQGGIIALLDGTNARVLAFVDSAALTAVRTGAVSGLATKLLSRKGSEVVGLIGSGEQARTQLEAVCKVRRIREARVYSFHFSHARRFAHEMEDKLGIEVMPCRSSRLAVNGVDILNVATSSATPVLDWSQVPRGCHINSIGALPERAELEPEIISKSSVYVDSLDGALREAGDIILAIRKGLFSREKVVTDLAGLVRHPELGRKSEGEVTLFKSVGFGLQDLYACSYLYDKVASNPRKFSKGLGKARLP